MKIEVRSYSGYRAEERPVAFSIGDKELKIKEVIDRWYGEDYEYFKVKAEDECTYILKYDAEIDEWELLMMEC